MPAKSSTRKRRQQRLSSKTSQPALKNLLMVLVALISLAIIAFAASHVYFRLNKKHESLPVIPHEQPNVIEDTTSGLAEPDTAANEGATPENNRKPKITTEPALAGTWVSNSSSAMITFSNNTYTLEMPSVEETQLISGSFAIQDGVLVLKTSSGPAACNNTTGRYTYMLKEDDLRLKLQSDGCRLRSMQLNSSFFRLY
ncbi:MAG: hypothetical protein IPM52_02515 [Bacteroidetes bacterium]|nr:hypothetical protein [Bacteroidota bacterium]